MAAKCQVQGRRGRCAHTGHSLERQLLEGGRIAALARWRRWRRWCARVRHISGGGSVCRKQSDGKLLNARRAVDIRNGSVEP